MSSSASLRLHIHHTKHHAPSVISSQAQMLRRLSTAAAARPPRPGSIGGWPLDRRRRPRPPSLHRFASLLPTTGSAAADDDPRGSSQQQYHRRRQPRRGFRLNPKYTDDVVLGDRLHKQVSFPEMARLILNEKITFGGALAAIGLASAASLVIPHIFGSVVDILASATPALLDAAAAGTVPAPPPVPTAEGEAGALLEELLPEIEDPQILAGLTENAWKMLGVTAVGTAATYVSTSQLDIVGSKISMDLRKRIFGNVLDQDLAFFDVNKTGELAGRLSTDVHEVAEHLVENLSKFLFSAIMAAGSAGMLLHISPALSAITLSVVPATVLGAAGYSRVVKRLSRELLNQLASSTQVAAERFAQIRAVRHFAAEEREKARYGRIIDDSMVLARRLAKSEGSYVAAIYSVSNFALIGVLFMGAGMVVDGHLTVGALASFCLYATNLSEAMKDATDGVAGMIKAQGAAGRLYALLEAHPTDHRGGALVLPPAAIQGGIAFEAVSFAYPTRPHSPVLSDFSLTVAPGENLGVTGPSGCGKSSLALLLTRMYALNGGRILLDGHDVTELDTSFLRTTVGVITQEPMLFSGTVRDNICYARPEATDEEVREAAVLANAHDFIMRLPQQYDTQIGERALVLSGGQKQRLSVARCMLARPRVLILDEATSALDASNQSQVLHKLLEQCHASTVIMIGHSPRQLAGCTRLVTLDKQGRIVRDERVESELPTLANGNGNGNGKGSNGGPGGHGGGELWR